MGEAMYEERLFLISEDSEYAPDEVQLLRFRKLLEEREFFYPGVDQEGEPCFVAANGASAIFKKGIGGPLHLYIHQHPEPCFYFGIELGLDVACDRCDEEIDYGLWGDAMSRYGETGETAFICPACGTATDLRSLTYDPPAGFARLALDFRGLAREETEVDPNGFLIFTEALGTSFRSIWARIDSRPEEDEDLFDDDESDLLEFADEEELRSIEEELRALDRDIAQADSLLEQDMESE